MASFQGELADFVVQQYNANPAFIEGVISQGEDALQAFVAGVLKNVKAGGIAGVILSYVEGGEAAFAAQLIAKYPPAQLYTIIGGLLASEAKQLGG